MNNIEQMIKVQELIYSNPDKLESILTAIESVLSPTIGEGDTVVAPEEIKAPKPWWEDYKWGEKDVGSLFLERGYINPEFLIQFMDGDIESACSFYSSDDCIPYTGDIKLHFKPWKAEEGKVPEDLGPFIAILWQDGEIEVAKVEDLDLECVFSPASDADFFHSEVVGYCNINFVNPITGE